LHKESGGAVGGLSILPFDTTVRARSYEAIKGLNKLRLQTVGNMHNGEHPFNQSRGTNMKQTRLVKILAAGMACAGALGIALAQETTTTTTNPVTGTTTTATTTSTGTIAAYTPDSDYIMFRTSTASAPVRYYYTKDTTILDPEGHTVTWSAIRPDMPATVYYTNVGDRVVVRKVVLSQPTTVYEKKETTTTTTKP